MHDPRIPAVSAWSDFWLRVRVSVAMALIILTIGSAVAALA